MIATQQEVVTVDGTTIKKEAAVIATDGGQMVALEVVTLEVPNPQPNIVYMPNVQPAPPEPESCCETCWKCDDDHSWHSLFGKGPGWVCLLLLMYLVLGGVIAALVLAFIILKCVIIFLEELNRN